MTITRDIEVQDSLVELYAFHLYLQLPDGDEVIDIMEGKLFTISEDGENLFAFIGDHIDELQDRISGISDLWSKLILTREEDSDIFYFIDMMEELCCSEFEMSYKKIATELNVSPKSLSRWVNRKTHPNHTIRLKLFKSIKKLIEKVIDERM